MENVSQIRANLDVDVGLQIKTQLNKYLDSPLSIHVTDVGIVSGIYLV